MILTFDPCFSRRKVAKVSPYVPGVYVEIRRLARRRVRDWPRRIECMTTAEIREGRKHGAGHGLYIAKPPRIKINAALPWYDVLVNVIHENLHHACPDATETQVDEWTDEIYRRLTKPKRANGRRGNGMAEPGTKDYHRRNLILDRDLALRTMDWHGGQGSLVYSLASTAFAGHYVSPSMIDGAVGELEIDLGEGYTKEEKAELENLIGELDAVARFSSEHTTKEAGLGDVDDGYATWLMERDNGTRNGKLRAKRQPHKTRKKRGRKPVPRIGKGKRRRGERSVLAAALRRDV